MDYIIPFKGLKEGKHQYKFDVNNKFFEAFLDGEIREGDADVFVSLIKRSTGLELNFNISGSVKVFCDRCLEAFFMPVAYEGKLFFEFGNKFEEVSYELIMLPQSDDELDLSQYIYEFINLSLPLQKIHPKDSKGNSLCNKEMTKRLNNNLKNGTKHRNNDPRWDKLNDLINN